MPRKRVIKETSFQSWDDVNEALRKVYEKQSFVDHTIAKYNEAEAKRRKALDDKLNPVRKEVEELEENMRLFCEDRRHEFGKKKSKSLTNGVVSFRTGTPKLKTLKGFTWKAVLQLIKNSVFKEDYIRVKESVDKEAIIRDGLAGQIDADAVETMGVEIIQEETFGYEVNESIKEEQAA